MRIVVLAYHSHNITGNAYANNDHVALAADLETITRAGARIVSLEHIAATVRAERVRDGDETLVGLSFDDGPVFDFADFAHPKLGPQRGFLNILRDFRARHGAGAQPGLHATSFVIASPAARRAMERAEECGFPYLEDWLGERWWPEAVGSGLMGIGNHSWDHVHRAVTEIAASAHARDNFERVDSYADADREIRAATHYINARVKGHCSVFAYPFGHVNDYLLNEYFPKLQNEHGMKAAFGTGGRAITAGDSVWHIPRAVCGHHWNSPEGLETLLAG